MKSRIKLTFLGTGTSQGIPVIASSHPVCHSSDPRDTRLRVSVLLEWKDSKYVIDCGPDFRYQMLRANCQRVDGVLFTHEHSDHTAGIDDIRPYYFKQGVMPFYAHKRVFESLYQRFAYIFKEGEKKTGSTNIEEHIIEQGENNTDSQNIKKNIIDKDNSFIIGGKTVIPIEAWHYKIPVLGFRIDDLTYLTDVKTMDKEEREKIKGSKVLVVNALRETEHHSHFNLKEALEFIEDINPERAYLTHISHLLGFHKEVEKKLPKNVFLAYDTLQIEI